MSRLQVGGFALVVESKHLDNVGRVVELIAFIGKKESPWEIGKYFDYWEVKYNHRLKTMFTPSHCLMPLGDKQGQDEIMKEKELEYLK